MTIIPFPDMQQVSCCKDPEWISLPVAPQVAARSCLRGESKLPQAVPLDRVLAAIDVLLEQGKEIAGLNIDGPGDPLTTWPMTMNILAVLQEKYPSMPLALTTLGFGLAEQAGSLGRFGVIRVNLLADTVVKETVQKLYTWIRPGKKNIPLSKAADLLVEEQEKAAAACRSEGISLSLVTTVFSGINEQEVEETARRFGALGAGSMTLVQGSGENIATLSEETLYALAGKAGKHIKTVTVETGSAKGDIVPLAGDFKTSVPKPTGERPNVAVLSSNGMDIDLHLGQAIKVLVYGPREDGLPCLLEARDLPEPGSGDNRWLRAAEVMNDCFVLLASSAGQRPRDILGQQGLPILLMEDNVEGTVDVLYGGGKKKMKKK